jgi:peptidoglycan/xylan/chitin deacetylase (PgdA/CDA1 family)
MIRASIGRIGRRALGYVRRFGARALILAYHQIADNGVDPWKQAVSPGHFAEHLQILRRHWRPMGLKQLVEAWQRGRIPDRSVVITFDDGYANHRHTVQPLLEQFDVPATFFVPTGQLASPRECWWDELEGLLTLPGQLPSSLSIDVCGKHYDFELNEREYTDEHCRRDQQLWAWDGGPGTRLAMYYTLWAQLRQARAVEQSRVMDRLLAWAGKEAFCRPSNRPLSVLELQELSSCGLVEIGAHTVTHPILVQLPLEQQQQEVAGNQRDLEQILDRPVESFAFPYGIYTAALVDNLRGMGFRCACGPAGGPVRRRTNRFLLPRETVSDCDGEKFARQMNAWYASGSKGNVA